MKKISVVLWKSFRFDAMYYSSSSSSPSSWILRLIQFMVLLAMLVILMVRATEGTSWCVARSNLSESLVQSGLDYVCRSGAYCGPINPGGRCYLPNTLQYHASYAFNSYYQSKSMGPGSCGFSPAAAVVSTDPSMWPNNNSNGDIPISLFVCLLFLLFFFLYGWSASPWGGFGFNTT